MSYIKREKVLVEQLTCAHPLVKRIWEYGGMAQGEGMKRWVSIQLIDDRRGDFSDEGGGEAIEKAEAWLKTLPEKL
jgi:hypothetical protein